VCAGVLEHLGAVALSESRVSAQRVLRAALSFIISPQILNVRACHQRTTRGKLEAVYASAPIPRNLAVLTVLGAVFD
jgi:hypothetical protein